MSFIKGSQKFDKIGCNDLQVSGPARSFTKTAAYTFRNSDSGAIFFGTTTVVHTLPTLTELELGWSITFVAAAADITSSVVAPSTDIVGSAAAGAVALPTAATGSTTIAFHTTNSEAGDWLKFTYMGDTVGIVSMGGAGTNAAYFTVA